MKKIIYIFMGFLVFQEIKAQIINPINAAKNGAVNKVNNGISNGVNQGLNNAESEIKGLFHKKHKDSTQAANQTPANSKPMAAKDEAIKLTAYNNYDFVAGEHILFEDHFVDDMNGEFPSHWKLEGVQGVVSKADNDMAFFVTKYYSIYTPNIKNKSYLPANYTIEFDTWLDAAYDANEGVYVDFRNGAEKLGTLHTHHSAFQFDMNGTHLSGDLPASIGSEAYHNKWHHIAIAVKGNQIKVYCDQYRVLVVPDCGFKASSLAFGGNASDGMNMMFKDVKIAEGGNMNMLGKKFTEAKIITHGINFDYNKATIKPESMGTLNMIVAILKENPELKFEIDGHTDGDGDDQYNMNLSQQRADAVKGQLVKMGIDASRLTTKGLGESKPISDNITPEGKANNRRVEFIKI
ncbi:MAG: OmpA family protein [Bacteroidetes bacterium]|nr:OmpA family protein [Bacteroidota bacterium]